MLSGTSQRDRVLPGGHFLIGAGERITRTGLAEPAEGLEALERITHGEDFITGLAGFDLCLDERDQSTEIIAETRQLALIARDRQAGVRVAKDVDRVARVVTRC